jgi:mono/diheme cytochrome c family protein
MMRIATFICAVLLVSAARLPGQTSAARNARDVGVRGTVVEFNRDIRPLLSDNCYTCHGPDKARRLTKLRFDVEADAKQDLGGRFAIIPGDAANSEIIRRITAANPARRMPPVASGRTLTSREIDLIQRWIAQGAKWQNHWSFIAPERAALPVVKNRTWARNEIDFFVLDRLEREGYRPASEADRTTLIRRVSLDLTGLPPTPAEVDAFVSDRSPKAYEKVVDRVLASPRYGERMGSRWLDAARYADTNGYQTDAERYMWRWRDWVIEAFNRNLSFDQFALQQIAGDMLPGATLSQKIATGFNRNHRGNGEGGIIPEEYAVEYVVDRVETTSTVFMGLTLGCARCHDHKYDPLTQKEFYQVFAYFNNIPERGKANKYGNSAPMMQAPTAAQQAQLTEIDRGLAAAEKRFESLGGDSTRAQRIWEASLDKSVPVNWSLPYDLVAHFPLDGDLTSEAPAQLTEKPAAAQFQEGSPQFAPGRMGQAARFDGKGFIAAGDIGAFGFQDKFTLAAWIYPTADTGAVITRGKDLEEDTGYGLYLKNGKVQANLVLRWLDDGARVETVKPIELNRWQHVMMTYDGSRTADGIKIYVDGRSQELTVYLDDVNQSFQTREPMRIGGGGGPNNRFRGQIDDVRVYDAVLSPKQAAVVANGESITEIAVVAPEKRTEPQSEKITLYFLENHAPVPIQQAWRELLAARRQKEQFVDGLPTVMVMQERESPRDTFLLLRGAYDKPGDKVTPGVPGILPPVPQGSPNNRLGFARWLVDPSNPLTARVAVNRFWQMYFGTGLVKTVEDFGSQGEWPSHPELLDWMATEFMRTGWDVKAMQKLIVTSATYRQSSKATPELLQKDPENRLVGRASRLRLPAGVIRDQALAVSGLLVEQVGGPSVKPYQPAGLWKELSGQDYVQDKGEKLYRRSLYTFWKRSSPPPSLMNFDAAGREACVVRETRTNTPLQALDLMNDVTYLEAARKLAERVMKERRTSAEERIVLAFRLVTARRPTAREVSLLQDALASYLSDYKGDPEAAGNYLSLGESPRDAELDVSELAAYSTLAGLILNLDETITKE